MERRPDNCPRRLRMFPFVICLLLVPALGAFAQELSVTFEQGSVSVQIGGKWVALNIGDTVAQTSTIRVGQDSSAEITNSIITIRLVQPGTYTMASLLGNVRAEETAGLGKIVANRLASLARTQQNSTGSNDALAGVRGSDQSAQATTQWEGGGNPQDLIAKGIGDLASGQYEAAFYAFSDAYDASAGPDQVEARYYMGLASYLRGNLQAAIRYLSDSKPQPSAPFYADRELTLAHAQLDAFSFHDVRSTVAEFVAHPSMPETDLQLAYLLDGLACRGLGDYAEAKTVLTRARDLNPASDAGQAAARVLVSLP